MFICVQALDGDLEASDLHGGDDEHMPQLLLCTAAAAALPAATDNEDDAEEEEEEEEGNWKSEGRRNKGASAVTFNSQVSGCYALVWLKSALAASWLFSEASV